MVLRGGAEGFYRAVHVVRPCCPVDVGLDPTRDDVGAAGIDRAGTLDGEIRIEDSLDLLAFDED